MYCFFIGELFYKDIRAERRERDGVTGSWLGIAHNLGIPVGVFPKQEIPYVNQPRNISLRTATPAS